MKDTILESKIKNIQFHNDKSHKVGFLSLETFMNDLVIISDQLIHY